MGRTLKYKLCQDLRAVAVGESLTGQLFLKEFICFVLGEEKLPQSLDEYVTSSGKNAVAGVPKAGF
ncbi:hypothetical protein D3C86_2160700 [compost metagenome]